MIPEPEPEYKVSEELEPESVEEPPPYCGCDSGTRCDGWYEEVVAMMRRYNLPFSLNC